MKKFIMAAVLASGFGCGILNTATASYKTDFELILSSAFINSNSNKMHVLRTNPELKKYCGSLKSGQFTMWSDSCTFKKSLPNLLRLDYATIQGRENEFRNFGNLSRQEMINLVTRHAQSLPPSAWHTYTIYPQQIIDKAKREIPDRHPDNVPNYPIGKNGTTVKLILHIDEHGNITQERDHIINLGWVHT